jgi:SRSO17 transposase
MAQDHLAQCAARARVDRAVRRAARHPRACLATAPVGSRGLLLAERDVGTTPRTKYYLVHLPATASLRQLVPLAHQRWAIEQQYQELKDELGLDHFEGRSWPGWQKHAVLTAIAYTFLQVERQRRPSRTLTLPRVRAILQEVLTAHFFITRPHYLQRMLKLQHVSLRI